MLCYVSSLAIMIVQDSVAFLSFSVGFLQHLLFRNFNTVFGDERYTAYLFQQCLEFPSLSFFLSNIHNFLHKSPHKSPLPGQFSLLSRFADAFTFDRVPSRSLSHCPHKCLGWKMVVILISFLSPVCCTVNISNLVGVVHLY